MTSGIFQLGRSLTLSYFDENLEPYFIEQNLEITNKTQIYDEDSREAVLVSIFGKDLIEGLEKGILEGFKNKPKLESDGRNYLHDWEYDLRLVKHSYPEEVDFEERSEGNVILNAIYETLGVYEDDKTANDLFGSIVLPYYLDGVNKKVEELEERLKEFANSSVASFGK
jgi:hypothetical protein